MDKDFADFYNILNITFPSSGEEIKAAYRRMARMHHPDRHPAEAETHTPILQEINRAYATLSHPFKKGNYDLQYRELVLGEVMTYEYYDPAPEDTRIYRHKYTVRKKGVFSLVTILIMIYLAIQVYRWIGNAAPIVQHPVAWQAAGPASVSSE